MQYTGIEMRPGSCSLSCWQESNKPKRMGELHELQVHAPPLVWCQVLEKILITEHQPDDVVKLLLLMSSNRVLVKLGRQCCHSPVWQNTSGCLAPLCAYKSGIQGEPDSVTLTGLITRVHYIISK